MTRKEKITKLKKQIRLNNASTRKLESLLRKVSKKKMRIGGGKPKGGKYEHNIADQIQKAFEYKGVEEGDVYRTKNSGGGKKQKGDIGLSSHAAEYFPFTTECKHYKKFNLNHLFVPYVEMSSKWLFKQWWRQLRAECKESKKPGILIIRANGCKDICALQMTHLLDMLPVQKNILHQLLEVPHTVVVAKRTIIILRFDAFLKLIGGKVSDAKVHGDKRDIDRVRTSRSKSSK
jgi:hypothetical protein